MSGAGTPPETGTFAASDDRYNGNMMFGAPTELDQTNSMMPGQPNDIFRGMPGQQPQGPMSPQPMAQQPPAMVPPQAQARDLSTQSNAQLAQALNLALTQEGKD